MGLNKRQLAYLAAVLLLTAIVYLPSLHNGFTSWDDPDNVVGNVYIRDFSYSNIEAWFTKPLLAMYTPFVYLSYAIDYKIGGLSPFVYHLHNLLLHLGNIALVFYAVKLLSGRIETALITALLFAVHPLNAAAVAPVSTRGTLLYCLFFLGSYIAYIYYLRKGLSSKHYIVSLVLFLFSALSKSAAVTLPLVFLATDYYFGRHRTEGGRLNFKIAYEKTPFFAVSLIFGILTLLFREDAGQIWSSYSYSFFERIFLVAYSLVFYIYKMFFPFGLSIYYPYPDNTAGYLPAEYYVSLLIIVFVVFTFVKSNELRKYFVFGLLFYLINIALVLKIIPVGHELVSDRYAYLPHIGSFFALAQFFSYINGGKLDSLILRLNGKTVLKVLILALSAYVVLFSAISYNRNFIWRDTFSLYKDMLEKNPESAFVHNQIAVAKVNTGDLKGGIEEYTKALQYDKNNFRAYFNRAKVKEKLNDYTGAIEDYSAILANKPSYEAYVSRGSAKSLLGDYRGAMEDFNKAVEVNKLKDSKAYLNRGALKAMLKDLGGAAADFDKAIELNPKDAEAYINRGSARASAGDIQLSILDFNKALQINPAHAGAYLNRGIVRLSLRDSSACLDWRKAAELGEKQGNDLLRQYCLR